MKKIFGIAAVALLLVLAVVPHASAGNVVATYAVADLGQGIWGGGPLFADGTANGSVTLSAANGQFIQRLSAQNWSWIVPGKVLSVCFDVTPIKGAGFPPSICATLPVTGGPVLIDENGDGKADFMMRLTLN